MFFYHVAETSNADRTLNFVSKYKFRRNSAMLQNQLECVIITDIEKLMKNFFIPIIFKDSFNPSSKGTDSFKNKYFFIHIYFS